MKDEEILGVVDDALPLGGKIADYMDVRVCMSGCVKPGGSKENSLHLLRIIGMDEKNLSDIN